jgi:acyl-[acyl-carrier-protein]-phospholipid O-acyltransferase/long-chain-fatty-acid--[acyl-carrier-protein] ligase
MFSHSQGRFITKIPRRIPYPVTVTFGAPLATDTPVADLRRAVHELSEQGWRIRRRTRKPLHRPFISSARHHPLRLMFAEKARGSVTRIRALAGVVALGRKLRPLWQGQQNVGILLPPSAAGAMVNIAASAGGRTSVNLNYTAGTDGMESACTQAGLQTLVTSRQFIRRAELTVPTNVEPLWIEEIAASIKPLDRLVGLAMALFAPARLIEKACGATKRISIDDIATIIFSSGSTGDPKGIMLSHFNVDSNVEAVGQVLRMDHNDRMLGVLPLFHSFGFMALWATTNLNVGIVFHPNPMDAAAVGELVHHYRVTILLGTPTFLQMYMRRCTPGQFGSLRLVVAGAEKLNPALAEAFEDHFGIRPLEGYGTTECSPVVAVSVPDFRAPGFFQPGARRGFVGQPLPGVAVRVVDPDTFEPLPTLAPGMLLVKGPNVMVGYLGRPDLTAEVMHDGWYITGDIAFMDEDGFVRITDRLSRFSKIGGEMVPHGKVEEELQAAADVQEQVFAVTGIPHEKKGEQLAVLYTIDAAEIPAILQTMKDSALPNLYIPRQDHFVHVDALPLLGTGKLDLRAIKQTALDGLRQQAL